MRKIHLTRNKLNELAKPRLIDLMLERLEYERLIEEGKDPRELLHYKYQNVPSEVIDAVIDIDPTKKKSYSQWLLSHWDTESKTIIRNLNNGRLEQLFDYFKNNNDVQIRSYGSVGAPLQEFIPDVEDDEEEEEEPMHNILTKSDAPTTILHNHGWTKQVPSELANDFDIVFNEDDWIIAVPNTYEADCKLGENMYWCTAGGRTDFNRGRDYYNRYLNDSGGRYYVNFDMTKGESRLGVDYPFTRYQFHFESHQFMDKEDDPVSPGEIDMPDSAKDFYISEGYSEEDFENEEERWQRYGEQRYDSYYRVTDELYLNIAYDDDYHWEEPTPDTDFYLFDENDDRDPISWEEIANPFVNDDIFAIDDRENGLFILNTKYGDENNFLLVIKNENARWRNWETHKIKNYLQLPSNIGIFAIATEYGHENEYTFFSHNGPVSYGHLEASNCENMFINEQCTRADESKWEGIFVETIQDGYHSLFRILYDNMNCDMDCIVKRDEPVNGEYFTINEIGLVEGQFRKYRVYNDDEYEQDDTYHNYNLEQEISNGNYLVSTLNDNGEQELNILKRGTNTPLLPIWFDEFVGYGMGLYAVEKYNYSQVYASDGQQMGRERGHVYAFFNEDGQQIGEWYEKYFILDKRGYCAGQNNKLDVKCDLISAEDRSVIATFAKLVTLRPIDNKILVVCNENGEPVTRGYDYIERQFCYPQFSSMIRIIHNYETYCCDLSNGGGKVIFDFNKQQIVANNIDRLDWFNRAYDLFKLKKTDGKFNVLDVENGVELLPTDSDTNVQWVNGSILCTSNNRYFLYDYRHNKMLFNPNGFDIEPTEISSYGTIGFTDGNYKVVFEVGSENVYFRYWQDAQGVGNREMDENTPQEVVNLYNRITGQGQQQQPSQEQEPSYAYTEQFKRMVNRMMIAEKLKYNDTLD